MIVFAILAIGPIYLIVSGDRMNTSWSTARSDSAGIAPNPAEVRESIIQIYAARVWGWRGAVAVHTWISVKPENAAEWTVYQVIGWRARYGHSPLIIRTDVPDRHWYGNPPELLTELRGEGVDEIITQVHKASLAYPFAHEYRMWPGPNSNTYIAWVARQVPALRLDLPPTAIGKDWLGAGSFIAKSPSGTGYQFSLLGVLGVTVGVEEGLEFNVGGTHFGFDPLDLALRLPGWGNVKIGHSQTASAKSD